MDNSENKPTENFFTNSSFKWLIGLIGGLIILIGVFALGVKVGFKQARFTENWAQDYPQNFAGFPGQPMGPGQHSPFMEAHGMVGTIISTSTNSQTLVIKDNNNIEKTVDIFPKTAIKQNFADLQPADLKLNESIIIIGSPNDQGQIEARLIRVLNPNQ